MKKKLLLSFLILAIYAADVHSDGDREAKEIALAENSIFWALIVSASPAGRQLCYENQMFCSDDRASLGLALLAAKNSKKSLVGFVELMRFRMDGGLSEDFSCYVIAKRTTVLKPLEKMNPKLVHEKCISEVRQAIKVRPDLSKDVSVSTICAEPNDINKKRKEFKKWIASHKSCPAENF